MKQREQNQRTAYILRDIIKMGVFLILLTPLVVNPQFFFPYVGPKSLYFMALVQIIFAAWLLLILIAPQYRPKSSWLFWGIIIFSYFLIFSSVFGANFSNSFWSKYERMTGLLMWFHLLAFFLVLSSVFKSQREWLSLFAFSLAVAILISFVSFFPKSIPFFQGAREGATLGNSSFLGSYLLFNAFLALILLLKVTKKWKILPGLALALMVISIYLNQAQAAFFSFWAGLFLLLLLSLIFLAKRKTLRIGASCFLFLTIVSSLLFVYFAFQPESSLHQKLVEKFSRARFVIWQIAWQGWLQRPWLGWGLENFDVIFAKHFNPCLFLGECGSEIWFDRAHNIVLDISVSAGFLGLLSYLAIFGVCFYLLFRKYRQEKEFWLPAVLVVLLVAYFLQNLTVFDMVASYLMFFLVLGFVQVFTQKNENRSLAENGSHLEFSSPKIILAVFLMVLMAFAFFNFVIKPVRAAQYVIKAVQNPDPLERIDWYRRSLATSALGKYQIRDFFGQQVLNFAKSEAVKQVPPENFKKEIEFVIEELEKTKKEFPLEFRSLLKLGQVYNLYALAEPGKALSKAEENLKKAIELSPKNQQGYWALSQTKVFQKNFQEAYQLAEKALGLEPKVAQSHLIVIQAAKLMADVDLAKEKAKEAKSLHPYLEPELNKILGN